jgi:hypothetical protein
MGRSVSYPSGAYVTFNDTPTEPPYCCTCGETVEEDAAGALLCGCDLTEFRRWEAWDEGSSDEEVEEVEDPRHWIEGEIDWREECQCWSDYARELWPSMWDADDWIGREDHVLASNTFAHFGVSEYCGLMAFWLVPRGDYDRPALAERWCAQQFPKLQKAFGRFQKVGAMSNGEGVYVHI